MARLLELVRKHVGSAWLEVVEQLRDDNSLEEIAARIRKGDVDGAVQGIEDAAEAFADAQQEAYVTSGETAASWLTDELDNVVRFDVKNKRAVGWAERNAGDLVREVTQEQRDLIKRVIADGVDDGLNPREIARDIRDSIGLTDLQAQIVANYRTALESGDWSDALGRALSDGRDDRAVAAAQRAGNSLSHEQIDKMVDRYRDNWVAYRAETIARSEGLRLAHQGTRELFQQAIDAGHVKANELKRQWHHSSHSKNPREDHEAMDQQTRGIDDPFESGSGALLMYPGDPDADVSETLNCACAVSTRLVA